ncbi:MAG TPA: DEAD/DEAH box helicase [Thermoanaerobaculia bacterium]|nr:DEAD/DEAH box helicase [Thermoanaerobaculia bacterium]
MSETTEKSFAELGLPEILVKTLTKLGYEAPTPIQERTIPVLLTGRDVIGQAQTGTGKTAAFALPMLHRIDPSKQTTQALVMAPTRELAMQVAEAIHSYARGMEHVSVLPVYGGAPMGLQLKHLERGVHIVVGTPGRLIDHLDRRTLDMSKVQMIVLDEADEMLKMGFIEEVERLLSAAPADRQIALFSATMPEGVMRIAQRHLRNPQRIEIEHRPQTTPAIEQRFLNVSEGQKLEVLTQILELETHEAVLIFRRTKNGAAELAERLQGRGFAAEAMHGDMTQPLRESVIRRLRSGQVEIVVATDVAARGLDVDQISHVINYDMPHDVEVYVHRIGRTGRAGRSGIATLFMTPRERRMMREIERYTGAPIKAMKMPTRADVAERRITVFKESIRKNLKEGDLDMYVELVEQLVDEGGFDMAEVAAAAARLANSSRPLGADSAIPQIEERRPEPMIEDRPRRTQPAGFERPGREGGSFDKKPFRAAGGADRERRPPRESDSEPKVRLSIAVGKNDGIRPADIVGSIANEADVPGRDIGPIDIRDDMTIVVIPAKYQDQVLTKVANAKFRGRPLNVRIAGTTPPEKTSSSAAPRASARRPSSSDEAPPRPQRREGFAPRPKSPFVRDSAASSPRAPYKRRDEASSAPRAKSPFSREAAPARAPYKRRDEESSPRPRSYSRDQAPPRPGGFKRREEGSGASPRGKTGFFSAVAGKGPGKKFAGKGKPGPKKRPR